LNAIIDLNATIELNATIDLNAIIDLRSTQRSGRMRLLSPHDRCQRDQPTRLSDVAYLRSMKIETFASGNIESGNLNSWSLDEATYPITEGRIFSPSPPNSGTE
jgi:hypothetical protein